MSTTIWPDMATAIKQSRHLAKAPLTFDPVSHLLSRFTFGATKADRDWLTLHGPDAWYANQISAGKANLGYGGAGNAVAKLGPLLTVSPGDLQAFLLKNGRQFGADAMEQLSQVTLGLQAYSNAQMYETVVDFFANHLNITNHRGDLWLTRAAFDRQVIRQFSLGSFTDMLLTSARHPAMLVYLNLALSNKRAVNENYARELLELHTVGLRYSESDVQNAAKLLTGRSLDARAEYKYFPTEHPTGPVRVLDFTSDNATAAGGDAAGDDLVRYLAGHTYTATFLAKKLCVRFVSDAPSATLIAAVAKAYLDGGTQILPMISTILRSTEFWESRGLKMRRPAENLVAAVRVLGVQPSNLALAMTALRSATGIEGNIPLEWGPPNGYPDVATAWRSASGMIESWNFHMGVAGGWAPGFATVAPGSLYGGKPVNSGQAIDMLTKRLTGMVFSAAHKTLLQTFLKEPASTPIAKSSLASLAVPLIATILDGPHHALR